MSVCQRGRACVWHSMSKWAAVRVPADYVRHRLDEVKEGGD